MGQIVRRKRKGRPSNSDRARSNFSAAPPSPVDRRRSRRRRNVRYNFDIDDYVDDDEFYDDEDEEVGRREKKLRLLLCEDDSRSNRRVSHAPASSSSSDDDEDDDGKPSKKRKIYGGDAEDDEDNEIDEIRGRKLEEYDDEEEEEAAAGGSDFDCDYPKEVPLPDKKTLELILDKLQKKDIYGVYAEPVDPDELPDYHDVIKHPMDFATVRRKLAKGSYLTLKEFENDVLLICSNAMQYNAPDTIYYKQASSIQEQAKLRFQRLRANVDQSAIEPKSELRTTPSFSLPKKQFKKPMSGWTAQTAQDPDESETCSGANVRTGEFPNGSSAQTPVRANSGEVPIAENENSSLADNNLDKDPELLPGKGFISKLGRKPSVLDENRRATYNISMEPVTESNSIFSTFEGESKQFIPVGLQADHSYARSLARFSATLGSVAWKVASQTIEQALPEGVKFGRGWVEEYEPLPTPVLMPKLKQPNFLAHFQTNEKTAEVTAPGIYKNDSQHDLPRSPVFGNSPRPPFSFQTKPTFSGSNIMHPNPNSMATNFMKPEKVGLAQVELNHPPPTHVITPPGFAATRPTTNVSNIPSPKPSKPVLENRNLASFPSFKNPNSNNGKPTLVNQDCNRMGSTQQQPGLSDPVHMMKMLAEKGQNQPNNNSNGYGFGSTSPGGAKREDLNNSGLKTQQHQQIYPNGSQTGLKRDDSSNVALTAAQTWMSLGGAGGFVKPHLVENTNPQQPQITRFRVPGVQNTHHHHQQQQPVHAFVPQHVRNVNEAHFQNKNVGYPQVATADLSRFQMQMQVQVQPSWRGVIPQMQQQSRPKQQESRPPDLNIGYQSMGSPVRQSTGMMVDSQQPDLALQL